MSFATVGEMAGRGKNTFSESVHLKEATGQYRLDDGDTLAPRWYNAKGWGKKVWLGIGAALAVIIIVVVVAAVMVTKKNKYPDYSKLSYSLADTCLLSLSLFFSFLLPVHYLSAILY